MNTCLLPVECTTDEYTVFEHQARAKGMDLSQWLVMVARNFTPPEMWNRLLVQVSNETPLELAYKQLDAIDPIEKEKQSLEGQHTESVNPLMRKPRELQFTKTEQRPIGISGHPCVYLMSGIYPVPHTAKTCQGTCTQPSRKGAPCFVGAEGAKQCLYYGAKSHPGHF